MSETFEQLVSRVNALEVEVQKSRDIHAIQRLKSKYAEACDLGYDPDAMASLFTPDAVWEFTNEWGIHRGRSQIRQFMVGVGKQIQWALHFMIGPEITVHDADNASGKWYLLELATMVGQTAGAPSDAVVLSGTYEDTYVKVDGAWKFKHVKLAIGQCSNLAEGWVKQPLR